MNDTMKASTPRRRFLKGTAAGGAAVALAAPWVRRAGAADTTTWKVQTSWPAGVGLETFQAWCGTIKEKTGGQLELTPFKAKDIVGDFELLDGVKNGVLEAMNSFTLYWAGKLPSTAFLSSYTLGLRYPHEWDIFFYSKGGLQAARDIFAKQGIYYVNRIHHGPNIIHSKTPIRSFDDFKDLKLRVPGGMIAETFAKAGAKTTLLPGGEVFSALEKGTIDAADYTGPAVNWALGFQQVTKYISMGPPGLDVGLSAGRSDGLLRQHGRLEQAPRQHEAVRRGRDPGLFEHPFRRHPEGRHGDLAEIHRSRAPRSIG